MKPSLRDYGLPDSDATGVPVWEATSEACPNCGAMVCSVKVTVNNHMVRGCKGTARYLGCPACQWASPAVVVSSMLGGEE